jgi:hypothetical protein
MIPNAEAASVEVQDEGRPTTPTPPDIHSFSLYMYKGEVKLQV